MAYDQDPTVPALTVRAAANRLGLSVWAVHKAVDRGELRPVSRHPIKVSAVDVAAMRVRRRDEAIDRIGVDRMEAVARQTRLQLHPPRQSGAPRGHAALDLVSERVKAAFGMPLLHGAALPDGAGCRWCGAVVAGEMLRAPVPERLLLSGPAMALLGDPSCTEHRGMVRARMRELAGEVHPGRAGPSGGLSGVSAGGGVPGSGRVAAVPSVAVSARPGRLRCGHLLAERCGCPRLASR